MAVITNISTQKNTKRANLFLDYRFYCGINTETFFKLGFKVGDNICEADLENLIAESESKIAFEKSLDFLAQRMYSFYEIEQKLTKKGFAKSAISIALDKLHEYGYANDESFAHQLVSELGHKLSRKQIEIKLISKHIDKNIIDSILQELSLSDESAKALAIAQKYMRNKVADTKNINKLFNYLLSKGFDMADVKCVADKYKFNSLEDPL